MLTLAKGVLCSVGHRKDCEPNHSSSHKMAAETSPRRTASVAPRGHDPPPLLAGRQRTRERAPVMDPSSGLTVAVVTTGQLWHKRAR